VTSVEWRIVRTAHNSVDALRTAEDLVPVLRQHAAAVDRTARFPVASLEALRHSGLLGLTVPAEYGGRDGDLHDLTAVAQVLAGGCLSTAMVWAMHCQQVDSLVRYAAPALVKEVLGRVAAGECYIASVTTEPASGGALLTAAAALSERDGVLVLRREAPVVTGGEHADGFLITMRDSADAPANHVTLVYADRAQLQLEPSGTWDPMGMRGTESVALRITGEFPSDQVVGERGAYRTIALESMIPLAHLAWSACWLGAARSAYADVVGLLRSRQRPRSLDPDSELVADRLARARLDLELVSGYLAGVVTEVTDRRADGRSMDTSSTQIHLNALKVAAAELTFRSVDSLVRLCGLGTGYLKNSPVPLERHFRDLRSASLNFADDRLLRAMGKLSIRDRSVQLI
jgi:acyl-CoA dehydrogenase